MTLGLKEILLITNSSVKPDQFRCIESVHQAINDINHHLSEVHEISMRSMFGYTGNKTRLHH